MIIFIQEDHNQVLNKKYQLKDFLIIVNLNNIQIKQDSFFITISKESNKNI
jgi:hypothetical protein